METAWFIRNSIRFVLRRSLGGYEREQGHVASSFEGLRHDALVLAASAGFWRRQDFGMRRNKATQKLRIFIVDRGNLFCTEKTRFFYISCWDRHMVRGKEEGGREHRALSGFPFAFPLSSLRT
jgi:hypothetical protein